MNFQRVIITAVALVGLLVLAGCGGGDMTEEADALAGRDRLPNEQGEPAASTSAAVTDESTDDAVLDWCRLHSVPESECTTCDPSLIASFEASGDWCVGHDLPESHCRLCNPGIVFEQEEILRARRLEQSGGDIEIMLNFRPNAQLCATDGALIQFASATTADRAGLSIYQARAATHEEAFEASAEIVFDETEATVVTTTTPALVSRWLVSPGEIVARGDVLAIIQSPDIAELKADLVAAQAEFTVQEKESARLKELHGRNLISQAELERQVALTEQARAAYVGARGLLMAAGLTIEDVDEVLRHGSLSNQFALRAPADGMVVDRIAQLGELLEAGRPFALLADPSSMWIEARVTEEQVRQLAVGDELVFDSDGRGLNRVGGKVIWISRMLDPHTRTATVRARVVDPNHRLQAGEFGRVTFVRSGNRPATLVPKDAVQWEGCCNVVFVREAVDRFRPRKVELHDGQGAYYQVTGGLDPGEEIVVDGAFLLKTELKKTSIGAGCCGLDPVG